MDKLSDLIKGSLNRHHLSTSAKSAEVLFFVNQLLDDAFNAEDQNVKAYKFDRETLFIGVRNATLSQEVWGKQEFLLEKLKNRFGQNTIKKIKIKSLTIN